MPESAFLLFSCDILQRLCYPWTPITLLLSNYTGCVQRTSICCLIWFLVLVTMVKSSDICCVPNGSKTREANVILHKFPSPLKESDRFRTWIYSIGGDVLALANEYIYKYRRVCHIHFEQIYVTAGGRLTNIAVPTLQLKGGHALQTPLMDITNQQNVAVDASQTTTSQGGCALRAPLAVITNLSQPTTSKGSKPPPIASRFCTEASTLARHVKQLTAIKDKYAVRLKKALTLSTNATFQKALSKFTTAALLFIMMQFREGSKNMMGRRFKKQEKIMALSLYKQGPKAYRWLRRIFVLPSPLTLSRMISVASLKAGINEKIFVYLKKQARKMTNTDKLCILLFDEMAISPHYEYNSKKDEIVGFVDNGTQRVKKIADHALVFMIRGITRNYKQPISYSFCSGSTGKEELAQAIKDHVRKLQSSGFRVVATVCDQGSSNVSAINSLIAETRQGRSEDNVRRVFEIDGNEVIPLYDPPHLIKGVRNNLITKNLTCTIDSEPKTAKWDHIVQLYNENPAYKGIRLMPKLTEQHVDPKKMPKMKVKFATQLLSRSVAVNMGYLAAKNILDPSSQETADVILFFDELFDSVNGGFMNEKKRPGKELLGPLKPRSAHQNVWTKSKKVLESMSFVTPRGTKSHVPTIVNWQRTLNNLEYLKNQLFEKYEIKSIWLRHFNQDPLENFFGCIRSHGYRNNNPTCAQFEVAFAALLINNLNSLHSPGSNCEKDQGRGFKSLGKIFFEKAKTTSNCAPGRHCDINFDHVSDDVLIGINTKQNNVKIMAQIEYVTGYILRKCKFIFKNCDHCKVCLYDEKQNSQYIKIKEYIKGKTSLSYPSDQLVECFSDIQDLMRNILKSDCDIKNIKNYSKTVLSVVLDFNFVKCANHKDALTNEIVDLSCRFFLYNWCKDTNKILKGSRQDFDPADCMQEMTRNYYLKRRK